MSWSLQFENWYWALVLNSGSKTVLSFVASAESLCAYERKDVIAFTAAAYNDINGLSTKSCILSDTEEKYFLKWKGDEANNTRFKLDKRNSDRKIICTNLSHP